MLLLRPASEDDMVASFLAAETTSERYGSRITEIIARLGQPRRIIEQPDTRDRAANAVRRQVLAAYRDYPNGDVFADMPAEVAWHYATLTPAELTTVRYINYPYWTDFSGGTRLVADGAWVKWTTQTGAWSVASSSSRRLGRWQHLPPGSIYRQIAENLRDGKLPPPIILLGEPGPANLVVLEGHKRLTGLLLCPQWLPAELEVLLGITASHHKQLRDPPPERHAPVAAGWSTAAGLRDLAQQRA